MFLCPKCREPLATGRAQAGIFWVCPTCKGRSATIALLRKLVPPDIVNTLWQLAKAGDYPSRRRCPACHRAMAEVPVSGIDHIESIDVCPTCQFVWFDPHELESLPSRPRAVTRQNALPARAREALAVAGLDDIRKNVETRYGHGDSTPDTFWQWIPGVLGMPVEYESDPLSRAPWITWILAAGIALISVIAFTDLERVADALGLVPAAWWRLGGLTLFTSFFLHGGPLHLIGNLYFLLIFGDNVEDHLGRWRYLLLLLAASVAGSFLHILANPADVTPCIGASGGISGIIAYYALTFPHARLGFLMRYFVLFRWITMSAVWLFAIWVLLQVLIGALQVSGLSNVAAFAHLGGAGVGVLFWWWARNEHPPT